MLFAPKQQIVYQDEGFDYDLTDCCGFLHRGPAVNLKEPYICCLGNSFTFGRYVREPYPAILAKLLRTQVINLGFGHLTPEKLKRHSLLLKIASEAAIVIAQFRFHQETLDLDFRKVMRLNWHQSVCINGMINAKYEIINLHYPDQTSHSDVAFLLQKRLDPTGMIL